MLRWRWSQEDPPERSPCRSSRGVCVASRAPFLRRRTTTPARLIACGTVQMFCCWVVMGGRRSLPGLLLSSRACMRGPLAHYPCRNAARAPQAPHPVTALKQQQKQQQVQQQPHPQQDLQHPQRHPWPDGRVGAAAAGGGQQVRAVPAPWW